MQKTSHLGENKYLHWLPENSKKNRLLKILGYLSFHDGLVSKMTHEEKRT